MEDHLRSRYSGIIYEITYKISGYTPSKIIPCSASLHKLVQEIGCQPGMTFNYNEEGRLHSQYLGDRYEPAIIIQYHNSSVYYYYLFDGEIKDCIHPFNIKIYTKTKIIEYYLNERIKQELPTSIHIDHSTVTEFYNGCYLKPVLKGYKHGAVTFNIADYPERDYFLHDYMEPPMPFKFAD